MTKQDVHVRPYDFRRPYQLNKSQLEAVSMVSETFTRAAETFSSGYLRTPSTVSFQMVDQMSYEEFSDSVGVPSIYQIFSYPPDAGTALLQVPLNLATAILDLVLGGHGKVTTVREFTEIEQTIFTKYTQKFLDIYAQAWGTAANFQIHVEVTDTNPAFNPIVGQGDLVVMSRFLVKVGDLEEPIAVVWPYSTIRHYASAWASHAWNRDSDLSTSGDSKTLNHRTDASSVTMAAVLGYAKLSLRDFSTIKRGDVVPLWRRYDDPIDLEIDHLQKFTAIPGKYRGKLAVRIQDRHHRKD